MIEIKNLSHSLGKTTVLNNINLSIPDGSILGLVGVNGAGKSTLLRCMTGVYIPDKGSVEYDGITPANETKKQEIFFLPDDPYYTMHMSCRDMLDMYRAFYNNVNMDKYLRLISEFGIDDKKPMRNFSKGMRRQVYIVCALALNPKYLLLDEAFDGLDPFTRKKVKAELISLVEENDTTIVISSHSLRELESFCDCFALISNNFISATGNIADRISRYCKFQLAFTQEINADIFSDLPVVSIDKKGKFVKIILEGESDMMYKALDRHSPAVIEQMPIDFEEAIISEIERSVSQ